MSQSGHHDLNSKQTEKTVGFNKVLTHDMGSRLGYLLRGSHEVDGGVVMVVFLDETEGELIVDQQVVCTTEKTDTEIHL